MDNLNPPKEFQAHGNLSDNWRTFKQAFKIYSVASGLDEKSVKIQSSTFLHVIGPEALDILKIFTWDDCDKHCNAKSDLHSTQCMIKKFDSHCTPKKNLTVERHIFFSRNQAYGEKFEAFLTDVKLKAKTCEFGDLKDSLIKDKIVGGIQSDQLRARLLREADLTLENAETICRAAEVSETRLKIMKEEHDVNTIKTNINTEKTDYKTRRQPNSDDCSYCGKKHQPRKCPAFGSICHNCGKRNHFMSVCRATKHVKMVTEEKCDENFFVAGISHESENVKEWKSIIEVQGRKITFTLDTGAQANILPLSLFRRLKKTRLQNSNAHLTSYCGQQLQVMGKSTLFCKSGNTECILEFQILDTNAKPILGLQGCEAMNLIQRIELIEDSVLSSFKDVFEGLGTMPEVHKIQIDPAVPPVVHPPRKVPAALRNTLLQELQRLEKDKIIEKVDHPTNWVNSLVIVEKKSGGLRLCLDPRDLNKAIKREHYQLPTIEEIVSRQSGNRIFSVLDASSAFWQIQLDEESSLLTTFNTPFGRYKFLRLPFGLNSAAEVFAKRFRQAFEDIPGVEAYMDELLISGRSMEEHDERLQMVLQAARRNGIKLKPSKCSFKVSEVTFVGHKITQDGLRTDNSKVAAIREMPEPSNRKDLQRFLGMANYLAKFIPNFSSITAPLRDLLKKENEWQWLEIHHKTVEEIKKLVTEAPILGFFDVNKPVMISVDASLHGLGAVLLQENKPIAYASRSLSECETRYAQIEKEMLAVVFGVEHFHYYTYGRPISVETDHKPLLSIISKPLSAAPPRLQRMLLRLMKYEVDLKYKPGAEMYISDTLSRAAVSNNVPNSDQWEAQIHLIFSSLPISDKKLQLFRSETENDESLQHVKKFIHEGWPENKNLIPETVLAYKGFQDELSEKDGLLFKGEQLIVPQSLQQDMLFRLHEGHMGRDKCLATAREVFFWPGMTSEIVNLVSKCAVCKEFMNAQQNEPLQSHEIPKLPWEKVGADIFQFDGKYFLLLVDYYSKFFEISLLSSTTGSGVIMQMKSQFARHGIPKQLMSDNGPQFNCAEFANFADSWDFQHRTSSPRYPKSNGLAERTIQTVKGILKKAKVLRQDPYLALLQYRNAPLQDNVSSAQLLMNRHLRTNLPATDAYLMPRVPDQKTAEKAFSRQQERQRQAYNRTALFQPLSPLQPGERIRMQIERGSSWRPATVIASAGPRSYIVKTENGATYRRNRVMLRQTKESFEERPIYEDLDDVPITARNASDQIQEHGGSLPSECPERNVPSERPALITRSGRVSRPPERFRCSDF